MSTQMNREPPPMWSQCVCNPPSKVSHPIQHFFPHRSSCQCRERGVPFMFDLLFLTRASSGRCSLPTARNDQSQREHHIARAFTLLPATPQHLLLISSHLYGVPSPLCPSQTVISIILYTPVQHSNKKKKKHSHKRVRRRWNHIFTH